MTKIPFHFPTVYGRGRGVGLLAQAAQSDLSGDGPFRKQSHAPLELTLGICKMLLTTPFTHVLKMAGVLQLGGKVAVPLLTSMI